jgi:formylglycine-generating enzyme required for sulfatase activity
MQAPEGTLISYATQPGNIAQDGTGGHSPYTNALAQTIVQPGLDIFQMFNAVGLAVMQMTGGAQQPWISSSPIKGDFYFITSATTTGSFAPSDDGTALNGSLSSRRAYPLSVVEEHALKPNDIFKECNACPEMVVVPPGSFTMGSPTNEPDRSDDEGPQHAVRVGRQFAVGRFALTFDEWDACVVDGGCNGYKPFDEGWGRGRRPVIHINWEDAQAYLTWISRKTGKSYRLLSEAEREYVTRAGTTTPFWFGSSVSIDEANYTGTGIYGTSTAGFRRQTVPVDGFRPNPWGLYQVHGNVREWTEDCYNKTYQGAPNDGSAWTTGDCDRRVLRNGSWTNKPALLRSAFRGTIANSSVRSDTISFRVARTLLSY